MKRHIASVVSVFAPLITLTATAHLHAETVYRCNDGRSYSQQPCPSGQPVQVDDARTPVQRQQAQATAHREAALANDMERERQAREAAPGANAIGIGRGAPHAASAASTGQHAKKKAPSRAHHGRHKSKAFDDDGGTLSAPVRSPAASSH